MLRRAFARLGVAVLPRPPAVPELAALTPDVRRQVWGRFQRRTAFLIEDWRWWASGLCVCAALYGGLVLLALVWALGWVDFSGTRVLIAALFYASVSVAGLRAAARLHAWLYRDLLVRELPGRCGGCGYDLRATGGPAGPLLARCPECGVAQGRAA